MKKIIATGLILATLAQSNAFAARCDSGETLIGAIGGAAIGGLFGNLLSNGDAGSTAAGALAGAIGGGTIACALDQADEYAIKQAHQQALNGQINRR